MRCPYCGGSNQEQAAFCVSCGRDLKRPLPNSQSQRPVTQTQQPSYPTRQLNQPAYREANTPVQPQRPDRVANAPAQPFPTPTSTSTPTSRRQPVAASRTATPPEPEPPGPFPPRTMAQLEALLIDSQAYTVVESHIENGKKKCLSITYPLCSNWQQTATLLKALREQQEEQYPTTLIKGVSSRQQDTYGFTNGQLQFDRNVRLGALVGNRYVIETGNGYSNDSLRFVINE